MPSSCLVIPQYTGTCWFNTILMVLFTGEMRHFIMDRIGVLDPEDVLDTNPHERTGRRIMSAILQLQRESESDYAYLKFFDKIRPESILSALHRDDPKLFPFNPNTRAEGGDSRYITRILRHLGIKYNLVIVTATPASPTGRVVAANDYATGETIEGYRRADVPHMRPDVLLLSTTHGGTTYRSNDVPFQLTQEIQWNGVTYVCDGLTLGNFNDNQHCIGGVTCQGKRSIYDGNLTNSVPGRSTFVPCPLFDLDWLLDSSEYCLNYRTCRLIRPDGSRCFSTHRSPTTIIYLRKDVLERLWAKRVPPPPRFSSSVRDQGVRGRAPPSAFLPSERERAVPRHPSQTQAPVRAQVLDGPAWFNAILVVLFSSDRIRPILAAQMGPSPPGRVMKGLSQMDGRDITRHLLQGGRGETIDLDRDRTHKAYPTRLTLKALDALRLSNPNDRISSGAQGLFQVMEMLGVRNVDRLSAFSTRDHGVYSVTRDTTVMSPDLLMVVTHGHAGEQRARFTPTPIKSYKGKQYMLSAVLFHEYNNEQRAGAAIIIDQKEYMYDTNATPSFFSMASWRFKPGQRTYLYASTGVVTLDDIDLSNFSRSSHLSHLKHRMPSQGHTSTKETTSAAVISMAMDSLSKKAAGVASAVDRPNTSLSKSMSTGTKAHSQRVPSLKAPSVTAFDERERAAEKKTSSVKRSKVRASSEGPERTARGVNSNVKAVSARPQQPPYKLVSDEVQVSEFSPYSSTQSSGSVMKRKVHG